MRRFVLLLLALLWLPGQGRADAPPGLDAFLETLRPCQLMHLTEQGYLRFVPADLLGRTWTQKTVRRLGGHALIRQFFRLDIRSSFHHQFANATSYQAGRTYNALREWMIANDVAELDRAALSRAASAAYARALDRADAETCVWMKWGNKWPDVLAQPLPRPAWRAIEGVFNTRRPDYGASPAEALQIARGRLTRDELIELRALRIALWIFESTFEMLANDRGGFSGNTDQDGLVCTDEAATAYLFVNYLEQRGLLEHFRTVDGRFAHRKPPTRFLMLNLRVLPNDHFAPLIQNPRTLEYFVLDSWVEDGAIPPHVSSVTDWFDEKERVSVAGLGDPELDRALTAGEITHADRGGLFTRLQERLSPWLPEPARTVPDGRPVLCEGIWCGDPPAAAW